MKLRYLPLPAFVLLLIIGCEKEEIPALPATHLSGTWELVASSSGWGGVTTYSTGNGNIIQFTSDRYERIFNGDKQSGKYKLRADISNLTRQPITRITFYDGIKPVQGLPQFVSVVNDTLAIGTDVYDGSAHYYTKAATKDSGL